MWVTAWQMLTRIAVLPTGSTILAVGASDAVRRALLMLGHHLGHQVIDTCSAENIPLVQGLGAIAVNYCRPDLAEAIKLASGGRGVAAAFDAVGGESWATSWQSLAARGLLVGYGFQDFPETGGTPAQAVKWLNMLNVVWSAEGCEDGTGRHTTFYDIRDRRLPHPKEYRADAVHLLKLITDGIACPPEAEVLPLAQAAEAHRRIAAGGLHDVWSLDL